MTMDTKLTCMVMTVSMKLNCMAMTMDMKLTCMAMTINTMKLNCMAMTMDMKLTCIAMTMDMKLTCMAMTERGTSSLWFLIAKCQERIRIRSSKLNSTIRRPSVYTSNEKNFKIL